MPYEGPNRAERGRRESGRISDERFMELSADYEAEQKKRKERATESVV